MKASPYMAGLAVCAATAVLGLALFVGVDDPPAVQPLADSRRSAGTVDPNRPPSIPTSNAMPVVMGNPVIKGPFLLRQVEPPVAHTYEGVVGMLDAIERGDTRAGVLLFRIAQQCAERHERLRTIEQLQQQGELGTAEALLQQIGDDSPICETFPDGVIDGRNKYLESAAESGDIRAQLDYVGYGMSADTAMKNPEELARYRDNVRRYLHAGANAGSVEAMVELAHQYQDGMFSEESSSKVWAAALMSVAATSGLTNSANEVFDLWSQSLSTSELEKVSGLSEEILGLCCG